MQTRAQKRARAAAEQEVVNAPAPADAVAPAPAPARADPVHEIAAAPAPAPAPAFYNEAPYASAEPMRLITYPVAEVIHTLKILFLASRDASEMAEWDVERVQRLLHEYVRFLWLHRARPEDALSPSPLVDAFWHHHLLATRSYADLCACLGLKFVHHDPLRAAAAPEQQRERYRATLIAYRAYYGRDAPAEFWPPAEPTLKHPLPLPPHDGALPIVVKSLTGALYRVRARADATVAYLKEVIHAHGGVSPCMQRLLCNGTNLDDACTLAHYNIGAGATVLVVMRLSGC